MTKVKIHFGESSVTLTKEGSFKKVIEDIFSSEVFTILTIDGTPSIAINTNNILFVEEIKEK